MKTDGWPTGVAILRRCVRCNVYRGIDQFVELGHICTPCMRGTSAYRSRGMFRPSRGIVITPKGRAALREAQPAA